MGSDVHCSGIVVGQTCQLWQKQHTVGQAVEWQPSGAVRCRLVVRLAMVCVCCTVQKQTSLVEFEILTRVEYIHNSVLHPWQICMYCSMGLASNAGGCSIYAAPTTHRLPQKTLHTGVTQGPST